MPFYKELSNRVKKLEGYGHIIEKVSNANGTAIKFSDGTMICYGDLKIQPNSNGELIFPISFVNQGYKIFLSNIYSNSPGIIYSYVKESVSKSIVYPILISTLKTPTMVVDCSYIAIGSWK